VVKKLQKSCKMTASKKADCEWDAIQFSFDGKSGKTKCLALTTMADLTLYDLALHDLVPQGKSAWPKKKAIK
jgi:hypothetical protein